jgi:tRNA modification GTPase
VIDGVLKALSTFSGVRPAEAGEFTRRAFMNGRLDLTQVEGLADLLSAHSDVQRRSALAQLKGAMSAPMIRMRNDLIHILALLEATLDFPDEGDVTDAPLAEAQTRMGHLQQTVLTLLADAPLGQKQRDGVIVTLVGAPNAGKSALLNWFARDNLALVSPIAGTTRDPVVCDLTIEGQLVRLVDTAGMRETSDIVETMGIEKSYAWASRADIILHLTDLSDPVDFAFTSPKGVEVWSVGTKIDLNPHSSPLVQFAISTTTGQGCEALRAALVQAIAASVRKEPALVVRERQLFHVQTISSALNAALTLDWNAYPELVAEQARTALTAIGQLTGHVGVEEMLDALFLEFCIGK